MKAVITGDIIQSTKMTASQRISLIKYLENALYNWSKDYNFQYEIYRGDSFQCLLNHPLYALRVALQVKTYIRGLNPNSVYKLSAEKQPSKVQTMIYPIWMFDIRLAIGIGEVEGKTRSLRIANGNAFLLSGRSLDSLKRIKQTLGIASNDVFQVELDTEFYLLDHIISKTTALQSEVICLKLLGYPEIEIAKMLGIAQSAVNQRSNKGGWNAIAKMVRRYESIYHSK
ncbi:MAG: hypothetical protein MUC81_09920 [Bacteroidia bacterium]|jgi:hypothetical protein|nr:hypothetical protein [Bacteroidia bacterium]